MFREEGGRPGDRRGFLHKSFLGKAVGKAVSTFVPGVAIARDVFQGARSISRSFGRKSTRATVPRSLTARPSVQGEAGKETGRQLKFGSDVSLPSFRTALAPRPVTVSSQFRPRTFGGGDFDPPQRAPCDFPMVRDSAGRCRTPTSGEFGGEQFGVGAAVNGRYGAALEPGSMIIDRAVCLKGMTLGNDGLCYNKGAITNAQRQWPRGRRPLLTGGDMRAIGIAARAGSKLDRTTKRLRALGMMKALPKGRGAPRAHAHAKQIAAVSVPQ